MTNYLTDEDINKSASVDILRSVLSALQKNVLENTVIKTSTYFDHNPFDSGFHTIDESKLPQINISSIRMSEFLIRRSFYNYKEIDKEHMSFRNHGTPFFYNFEFGIDIIAKSHIEVFAIREKLYSYYRKCFMTLDCLSGLKYNLDLAESDDETLVKPSFSDLCMVSTSLLVSQVAIFPNNDKVGVLMGATNWTFDTPINVLDNKTLLSLTSSVPQRQEL